MDSLKAMLETSVVWNSFMYVLRPFCNIMAIFLVASSFLHTWKDGLWSLGLVILLYILDFKADEEESKLRSIPNAHWSAPYSKTWILYIRYTNRENKTLHAAHQKYGSLIRIGPREISTNAIRGIKVVYGGGLEKGSWYSVFNNFGVPNMFASHHKQEHSARKKMISGLYAKSYLHKSEPLQAQATQILFGRLFPLLEDFASAKSSIDVHNLWFAVTMDFINAYLFGLKNGSNFLQDKAYSKHWLELYHSRKIHSFFPHEFPRLCSIIDGRLRLGLLVPKWVDKANREIEDWCIRMCDDALAVVASSPTKDLAPADEPTVVRAVVEGIDKEWERKGEASVLYDTTFQNERLAIASEMLDHLAAGHETSGITLTYLAYELSKNPALQLSLRHELLSLDPSFKWHNEKAVKRDFLGFKFDTKELDSLPILNAILTETLRLYAAIPGSQPRMTSPSPLNRTYLSLGLKTHAIGPNVRINSQAYSLHRNPYAFPNPEVWDYTRWMPGKITKEMNLNYWPFSSGGRMCVGSHFALHEIKLVVAAVYSNFRTVVVDDEGIEQMDGYTCGPTSNKLILRFERADN